MFKIIAKITSATAILATATVAASAETYKVTGTVTAVEIVSETMTEYVPYTECGNVEVPIYGNVSTGANGGEVLSGMIIGGLLGKGITGKDNGAAAGAILGGVIAADKKTERVIVGYNTVRQCHKGVKEKEVIIGSSYNVTYSWNGLYGTVNTNRRYYVDDSIEVNITLN